MNKTIRKSNIKGELTAPGSKSALQRIIAAAMLSKGESLIRFGSISEDSLAVLEVARKIGANVLLEEKEIRINGGIHHPDEKISVGESGLGLRMLAPILSATGFPFEISGRGSLLKRPVDFVVHTLQASGVTVSCSNNSLPLKIQGPVSTDRIEIDGSSGSQLLTGFLMAAPLLQRDVEIHVKSLKSKPYIDLTLSILKEFKIEIFHTNYELFKIKKGQTYTACSTSAEGDWSGSAFILVAAAISGQVKLYGLNPESTQGDKTILDALTQCGATVNANRKFISIKKGKLDSFEFDATHAPDLFPPLVALAVNCKGKSVIKGVSRLKHKESDRGLTLQSEFRKLGADIQIDHDLMVIKGGQLRGSKVCSHHDHRIAMALTVAALTAEAEVLIEDAEAVGKSWPAFFDQMKGLGVDIH